MFINKIRYNLSNKKGFTIIELLIAIAGFSFVLLLVTIVVINIGQLYSKGIYQTRIDDAIRYAVDDITNKIKFDNDVTIARTSYGLASYGVVCVGGAKYSYNNSFNQESNFIRRITLNAGDDCSYKDNDRNNGMSLLPTNTTLAYFNVIPADSTNKIFKISISLIYGDVDNTNLKDYTPPNDREKFLMSIKCNSLSTSYNYCATSSLSTVVSTRLN